MGELPKTSKRVTRQSTPASNGSSGRPEVTFSLTESFQKTLEELDQKVSREFQATQSQRNEQDRMLGASPQVVQELLDRAKNYYSKKEYTRAFTAWENVCSYLPEGDAFRRTVVSLRDSHANLERAQRELNQVRDDIHSRFSMQPNDRKFVDKAQEAVNGDIKKAYAHINREIRSDRTPQTMSFWWPVLFSVALLAGGGFVLWGYHSYKLSQAPVATSVVAPAPIVSAASKEELDDLRTELMMVTAERDQLRTRIQDVDQQIEAKVAEAKRQAAGSAKEEREKIIQLETRLRESEEVARQLQVQVDGLMQDNIAKDKVIQSLD